MNKPILIVSLLTGAVGCFGSDPNMNSQIFEGQGGSSATGTAGSTGSGGSGPGTGGMGVMGAIKGTAVAAFATGTEGFQLNPYHDPNRKNLADSTAPATPAPALSFDMNEGNPDNGSLKVTATYSGPNQYLDIQSKSMMSAPQDWHGGKLHVRIKADSGNFGSGAQPYVLTGNFVFGGTHSNFVKNSNWQEFTVDLDNPVTSDSGYDPTKVIVFGVQLTSDSMGVTGDVTFHIDSFSVEGVPGLTGAAGTGGASGTSGAGGATGGGGGCATGSGGASGNADASAGG